MEKEKSKYEPLKNYHPFNEIEICSNYMKDMKSLFYYDNVGPLLIGKGERPIIWISLRKPETFTWYYVVLNNISYNKDIIVDISRNSTTIVKDSNEKILIDVEKLTDIKARINSIDLRPLGFNVYCEDKTLIIGLYKFTGSTFDSSSINFQTTLKDLYSTILNRFPAGREASYLLNTEKPDPQIVKNNLKTISQGFDSDKRYTDDYSKLDALNFIKVLENILSNLTPKEGKN